MSKDRKKYDDKYAKTKSGIVSIIYKSQKVSSRKRGHRSPEYTRLELKQWLYSQELFHALYSEWVNSGFLKRLKPSVDRKNDDVHYCMSNIQLMTWGRNNKKSHKDLMSGKLFDNHTPVTQLTKSHNIVNQFISQGEASRETGISQGNIGMVCRGERKMAGGYRWKYTKDTK